MVRQLAQLYPKALEMRNANGDTALHQVASQFSSCDEIIVRELAELDPAALCMKNSAGDTPLHKCCSVLEQCGGGSNTDQCIPSSAGNDKCQW